MRSIIAVAALVAVTHGAPNPITQDSGPVSIPLTKKSTLLTTTGFVDAAAFQNQINRVISKYTSTLAAYRLNVGTAHPLSIRVGAANVTKRAGTGSVPLTDDGDSLWQGSLSVGTPPVTYTVDFDTGSSDLFLPDANCGSTCAGHTLYNPAKSSTSRATGKTFTLAYGDGSSVSGKSFTDKVTVGGLTATNQVLGSATTYSTGFQKSNFPPDGLAGMAFPQIAVMSTTPPLFNTLIAQKQTAAGVFGFKLASTGSELFLGGVDTALIKGALTPVPVTTKGYWQVTMDSVNVNGKSTVAKTQSIVDTGTTLIIGSASAVKAFWAAVPGSADASATFGSGFFSFPCNSTATASITFGGVNFDFTRTLSIGAISPGTCIGSVASANVGINAWIVGDAFLRNVYAEFSFDQSTVSFAKLA